MLCLARELSPESYCDACPKAERALHKGREVPSQVRISSGFVKILAGFIKIVTEFDKIAAGLWLSKKF